MSLGIRITPTPRTIREITVMIAGSEEVQLSIGGETEEVELTNNASANGKTAPRMNIIPKIRINILVRLDMFNSVSIDSRRGRLQILLPGPLVGLRKIHLVPERDHHQLFDQGLLPALAVQEMIHR